MGTMGHDGGPVGSVRLVGALMFCHPPGIVGGSRSNGRLGGQRTSPGGGRGAPCSRTSMELVTAKVLPAAREERLAAKATRRSVQDPR